MRRRYRKPRAGESVCTCTAYPFPHRWGGGDCKGLEVVAETWEANQGRRDCETCHCNCQDAHYCEVLRGQEHPKAGDCWREFVRYNEIKIYGKLAAQLR